jgi:hypothetical protein
MSEKKNTDFSSSAVNLTNPPEVKEVLYAQVKRVTDLDALRDRADAFIPDELKEMILKLESEIGVEDKSIRGFIDTFGSYQDLELGRYALKQRRESVTYKPELARKILPGNLASFAIMEVVDVKAIEGLVKGKIITPEQAKACGEVHESYAYIIK